MKYFLHWFGVVLQCCLFEQFHTSHQFMQQNLVHVNVSVPCHKSCIQTKYLSFNYIDLFILQGAMFALAPFIPIHSQILGLPQPHAIKVPPWLLSQSSSGMPNWLLLSSVQTIATVNLWRVPQGITGGNSGCMGTTAMAIAFKLQSNGGWTI